MTVSLGTKCYGNAEFSGAATEYGRVPHVLSKNTPHARNPRPQATAAISAIRGRPVHVQLAHTRRSSAELALVHVCTHVCTSTWTKTHCFRPC